MFFSAQKNKCCSLDFHQDHNIYYRAKKRSTLQKFCKVLYFGFDTAPQAKTFGTTADAGIGGYFKSVSDVNGTSFEVDDDTYRFLIRARIAANISNTTPQGVMNALNFILETNDCLIEEVGIAHLVITYYVTLTPLQEYFLRGLSSIGSIIPIPICVSYELVSA